MFSVACWMKFLQWKTISDGLSFPPRAFFSTNQNDRASSFSPRPTEYYWNLLCCHWRSRHSPHCSKQSGKSLPNIVFQAPSPNPIPILTKRIGQPFIWMEGNYFISSSIWFRFYEMQFWNTFSLRRTFKLKKRQDKKSLFCASRLKVVHGPFSNGQLLLMEHGIDRSGIRWDGYKQWQKLELEKTTIRIDFGIHLFLHPMEYVKEHWGKSSMSPFRESPSGGVMERVWQEPFSRLGTGTTEISSPIFVPLGVLQILLYCGSMLIRSI